MARITKFTTTLIWIHLHGRNTKWQRRWDWTVTTCLR